MQLLWGDDMPAWINEFHYDNSGTDAGEYVEIAASAGTNLAGWTIILYNGSNGTPYDTLTLSGTVPNQQNGFGTLSFAWPSNGLQNGAPDGIALVDPMGNVVEFISYEGSFTAVGGLADGMTSTNVGVSESGSAAGTAIGRTGTGDEAADFAWSLIGDDTPGGINIGQSFSNVVVDQPGTFSIADATVTEGNGGTTPITFTVTRGADSNVAASVSYTVTLPGGAGGADSADFAAPALSGTLNFAANEFSKTITLDVAGDLVDEPDETFTVTLSAPTNGAAIGDGSATGTIANDDSAVGPGAAFINEIHYDNASTDAGEAIEIAGPAGLNLTGWKLVLYSVGTGEVLGEVYNTRNLSGIVPDQDDGYGTLSFAYPVNGIQNGPSDGVALVDPDGNVVQFLSYEGSFEAADGPAAGMTSTDIGVSEGGSSPLGFSLQLTGEGASYADFAWQSARDDNFGAVNADQDFIGPDATGQVRIHDSSIVEGDSGETLMVFTVTRAGGLGQTAGIDWFINLAGSADSADLGGSQPLSGHVDFEIGVASVQIAIAINGDTTGEDNETLNVLLANPTGNIAIVDSSATGTILNDDPIPRAIYEIQGEGHRSAYEGQPVLTAGIVTVVASNGFYLQDAAGDGDARTSDGIFVFTGAAPGVAAGDAVEVTGTVEEFLPGGDPANLTVTEIAADNVVVQSTGHDVAALLVGAGGVLPPTSVIDDDGLASYDPDSDGIDFYESLEGMLVTVEAPQVVQNSTSQFGETFIIASGGDGATGMNDRGGITISDGDINPERILLVADDGQVHTQGDRLADVTGVMSYGFEHYRLLASEPVVRTVDVTVSREDSNLEGGRDHLTVASYNVQNLSPADNAVKFDLLAGDIVYSLNAPDIVGLQEMQDGNGLNGTDPLSAAYTAQLLIDAIEEAGGPSYVYVEIAPTAAGQTGGEPGGNIRNGFLYNPDRVDFVEGSLELIEDPAFNGSRRPLVADFVFNGQTVSLINVHFTARLGGDPAWGSVQPAPDAGDASRTAQATAVGGYVNDALATDPSLQLGVLGDFNGFWFEGAVEALENGSVMTDLHHLLAEAERYTARFDGNLQGIDHILVTGGLLSGAEFDAVHRNAEQPFGVAIGTDHDPILARFYIEHANEAPEAAGDSVAVDEDSSTGNLVALLLGNDTDPDPEDVHAIVAVDDSGLAGSLVFDADAHTLVYVADDDVFDMLDPGETLTETFTYTVADQHGLTDTATVSVTVTGVDDGIDHAAGNGDDSVDGTAGEDRLDGGNGADILAGLAGHDRLLGGNGDDILSGGAGRDRLEGGRGDDLLEGGDGADLFVFGKSGGADVVIDFERGVDKLFLTGGVKVKDYDLVDWDGDGVDDLVIDLGNGGSVTLLGVQAAGPGSFAGPEDLASYAPF